MACAITGKHVYESSITSLPAMLGTTYMEGGDKDDYGSGTVTISLVSQTKPGTFYLESDSQGKVKDSYIVLYGDFRKKNAGFGENYESSLQQVTFRFRN